MDEFARAGVGMTGPSTQNHQRTERMQPNATSKLCVDLRTKSISDRLLVLLGHKMVQR
jgi:hypothetical protein